MTQARGGGEGRHQLVGRRSEARVSSASRRSIAAPRSGILIHTMLVSGSSYHPCAVVWSAFNDDSRTMGWPVKINFARRVVLRVDFKHQ